MIYPFCYYLFFSTYFRADKVVPIFIAFVFLLNVQILSRTCIYSVPGSEFRMFRSFAQTDIATFFFSILQPHFKVLPHC